MIITKKAIPRRLVLRGLGATLALPLLDGMVPALTALAKTPAKSPLRFSTVYVPNGIHMDDWTPTTPLPMEYNPRLAFERLFGDSETTDSAARAARSRKNRSMLDSLTDKVSALAQTLGPSDRVRLDQYLEAVRDVERRIQRTEA